MSSVNKAIILGHLGREPEVRYTPSGEPVANVTIATSSKYKDKSGELVEETEWHRVTFFGKLAQVVENYLHKGSLVYVEGRIKTRKYTDKDGVERYSTDIIASEMKMLGGKKPDSDPAHATQRPQQAATRQQSKPTTGGSGFDDMDDDIPF